MTTLCGKHTLNDEMPGVSSDHCSPIDVLVTVVVDTSRPATM